MNPDTTPDRANSCLLKIADTLGGTVNPDKKQVDLTTRQGGNLIISLDPPHISLLAGRVEILSYPISPEAELVVHIADKNIEFRGTDHSYIVHRNGLVVEQNY